jgi:hypothetical protein
MARRTDRSRAGPETQLKLFALMVAAPRWREMSLGPVTDENSGNGRFV